MSTLPKIIRNYFFQGKSRPRESTERSIEDTLRNSTPLDSGGKRLIGHNHINFFRLIDEDCMVPCDALNVSLIIRDFTFFTFEKLYLAWQIESKPIVNEILRLRNICSYLLCNRESSAKCSCCVRFDCCCTLFLKRGNIRNARIYPKKSRLKGHLLPRSTDPEFYTAPRVREEIESDAPKRLAASLNPS